MGLSDITDRRAVLSAIAEFDELGRDRFLAKYGFGRSRGYWLVHDGKRYDSKAIVGAAHGYMQGTTGPLSATKFTGGEASVKRRLESLDFFVETSPAETSRAGEDGRPAFLLTWKETGWPYSNIVRMLETFERQGYVDEPWRIFAHRLAQPGDRVYVLKQGSGERGIFGVGEILGRPSLGNAGNGKQQMMAVIRFSSFADPNQEPLIHEVDVRSVLKDSQIRAQASGYPLLEGQHEALEAILGGIAQASPAITAASADEDPFDPANIADARERIRRSITQRRGQRAFRNALIGAYRGKCAISGCDTLDVLEAAHIYPYRGPETNKVVNGLLLRSDLHTLFDCGLIAVDPETMRVVVAAILRAGEYGIFAGRCLRPPEHSDQHPSNDALRLHREAARL